MPKNIDISITFIHDLQKLSILKIPKFELLLKVEFELESPSAAPSPKWIESLMPEGSSSALFAAQGLMDPLPGRISFAFLKKMHEKNITSWLKEGVEEA